MVYHLFRIFLSSVLPLLFVYLNGLLDFFNLSQKNVIELITEDYFEAV